MHQPLPLLTKNETIFWEHKIFVNCCHSNTAIYIFCVFFFLKLSSRSVKIMGKNICFNLGFIDKYLFCHPYVTMPNVSLNLV